MTHDKHVADALEGLSSIELTGWIEYFKLKDEIQQSRLIYAIVKAFNGDKKTPKHQIDDGEEIIDTTKPEFAEQFKGFINTKSAPQQQGRPARQQNTQIIMG